MKIAGIIAEYNPLHRGHVYHMLETRARGADKIVAVLGGEMTQRGEMAMFDKFARARSALQAGADAVVELPAVYAARSARDFALGGVSVIAALGADMISFGSETGDITALKSLADKLENETEELSALIKAGLDGGMGYPAARAEAVKRLYPELSPLMASPNDALALEYLQALIRLKADITPVAVKRQGDYHDGGEMSASCIRKLIREGRTGEALKMLPEETREIYASELPDGINDPSLLEAHVLLALRNYAPPTEGEGLKQLIVNTSRRYPALSDVADACVSRRYTRARVLREMGEMWLDLPPVPERLPYVRLLGAKKGGEQLLKELKRRAGGLLVSDPVKLRDDPVFRAECRLTDAWGLGCLKSEYRLPGRELTQGFISVQIPAAEAPRNT
ncbi:MAG: nucleotidyltransferase family protein [Clostridia bacterium]|nr:nucleotidyltransferase family protein [Clostridia bacterium]